MKSSVSRPKRRPPTYADRTRRIRQDPPCTAGCSGARRGLPGRCLVRAAGVRDDVEFVLPAIATTLGAKDGLGDYLRPTTLLVLDNLEHLVETGPRLRSCSPPRRSSRSWRRAGSGSRSPPSTSTSCLRSRSRTRSSSSSLARGNWILASSPGTASPRSACGSTDCRLPSSWPPRE